MHSSDEPNTADNLPAEPSSDRPQSRVGIRLTVMAAVPLIRVALDQAGALRRRALVRDVVERHKRAGNVIGVQSPVAVVKKALHEMCATGEVVTVGFGTWALAGQASDYRVPLVSTGAIPLIREALAGGRALPRKLLAKEIAALHAEAGGVVGTQNPLLVTKKALQQMVARGEVESIGFGTWSLTGQAASYSVPLTPNVAKPLIIAALVDGQIRHRKDLAREVTAQHKQSGGAIGLRSPAEVVAQALTNMARDGTAEHVSRGLWRLAVARTGDVQKQPVTLQIDEPRIVEQVERALNDSVPSAVQPQVVQETAGNGATVLTIEEEIGEGQEVVYVYYNNSERRLAQLEGRLVWDCKIGYAKTGDVLGRILEQGIKTSMARLPTVGLVIRTHDCRQLEKIIHATLRFLGHHVPDSVGAEWFETSPAAIKRWYESFLAGTEELRRAD